jgi:hypothetical protein
MVNRSQERCSYLLPRNFNCASQLVVVGEVLDTDILIGMV